MYYDYAEQVLEKAPNSEECTRMYHIAEEKLHEVNIRLLGYESEKLNLNCKERV